MIPEKLMRAVLAAIEEHNYIQFPIEREKATDSTGSTDSTSAGGGETGSDGENGRERGNVESQVAENSAFIELKRMEKNRYTLIISVVRKGTDREYSNYMKSGTYDEVIEYVKKEETVGELIKSYEELSKRVDEYWG